MADKHSKTLVIRDDDISYFTSPDRLKQVYTRLWEKGLPVCLAVIPAHNANVHVAHREGNPFDPSIAKEMRGQDFSFPVSANQELCTFLEGLYQEGLIEICLHGFTHGYMEFSATDDQLVDDKLNKGRKEMENAFPDTYITTFIAPYDNISPEAFSRITAQDYDVCTIPESVPQRLNAKTGSYQHLILPSGNHAFTCSEYLFTHREQPQQALSNALRRLEDENFLIITNHYWTFFYDWSEPTDLLTAWDQFLDRLLQRNDVLITTFQQLRSQT